jgi:hypothetical protein
MDDTAFKTAVYAHVAATGRVPTLAEAAAAAGVAGDVVRAAWQRLWRSRVLVLEGDAIRMAPPFSGVPTQHHVVSGGVAYEANCAWDALGIPAALHRAAEVTSRCEQTQEPLHLRVSADGSVDGPPWVVHFAVPAAHWWRDIVFT